MVAAGTVELQASDSYLVVPIETMAGWLQTGATGPQGLFQCASYWVQLPTLCLAHSRCLKQWVTSRTDKPASLPTSWEFKMGANLSNYILSYDRPE